MMAVPRKPQPPVMRRGVCDVDMVGLVVSSKVDGKRVVWVVLCVAKVVPWSFIHVRF